MREDDSVGWDGRAILCLGIVGLAVMGLALRKPPPPVPLPDWTIHGADGNIPRMQLVDREDHFRFEIDRWVKHQPWEWAVRRHVPFQLGQRYVVSFEARSDEPRSMQCLAREFHPAWSNLGLSERLDLTSDWKAFRFAFTPTSGTRDGIVEWLAGDSPIAFEIRQWRLDQSASTDDRKVGP